jgi:hypothetical protein
MDHNDVSAEDRSRGLSTQDLIDVEPRGQHAADAPRDDVDEYDDTDEYGTEKAEGEHTTTSEPLAEVPGEDEVAEAHHDHLADHGELDDDDAVDTASTDTVSGDEAPVEDEPVEEPVSGTPVAEAAPADRAPASNDVPVTQLFAAEEVQGFRDNWQEIQIAFVDDPKNAVSQADELVAAVIQSLAATFAEHKSELESQWNQGEAATEDLRLALRQYRSFFNQLLSS